MSVYALMCRKNACTCGYSLYPHTIENMDIKAHAFSLTRKKLLFVRNINIIFIIK